MYNDGVKLIEARGEGDSPHISLWFDKQLRDVFISLLSLSFCKQLRQVISLLICLSAYHLVSNKSKITDF